MKAYPLYVARKLSLSSGGRRSSPAVRVAVVSVALSVAVMLAALAIVGGFKSEITRKVVGFSNDISIYALDDESSDGSIITLTPTLRSILDNEPYITSYYLEATVPAVFKTETDFKGIYFKGRSPEADMDFFNRNLVEGRLPKPGSEEILISAKAASQLGLKTGDRVPTYFMVANLRMRNLEIAGIFDTNFESFDDLYVYGPISLVQSLTDLGRQQGTSIQIMTDDFKHLAENTSALHNRLIKAMMDGEIYRSYQLDNALNNGAGFFNWLSLLDTNVAVILALMILVACVSLISGILIIIMDKMRFIGLMKALGASDRDVSSIFLLLALKVSALGLVIGNVLMLALLAVQDATHFIPLDASSYYIGYVPVKINAAEVIILNAAVLFIIFAVLLIPSRFVSRIKPAQTMRYE